MIYYISDLHLGHGSIIGLSKRPFATVEEMDRTIIQNWNSVVKETDDVYILGDFISFKIRDDDVYARYLERLHGKMHLILGNHDEMFNKRRWLKNYFVEIVDTKTVVDGDKKLFLCHYPVLEYPGYFKSNVLHFYGHIHNNVDNDTYKILKQFRSTKCFNVGADILDFFPRTKEEVIVCNNAFYNSK